MGLYKEKIEKMTLEEKASLLSGKDFWHTRAIKRLEIPSMAMADGPHGLRKQASEGDHLGLTSGVKATCFPTSATMANSWDLEICEAVGQALSKEAAYHQVNILLGPGLNIKRNPLCGRNFEYFSEDPYLSGKMAAAYTKGIQNEGVSACLKHFAANNQEYLRMTNDSIVDLRTLHEIYLTGFEIAIKEAKPKAIMSAYNRVNGTYANENKYLLRDVLVDQWAFDGIVVSDWGGSNNPVEGVKAGAHVEMPTPGLDSIYRIVEAVKNGILEEKILDEKVEEYLKVLYDTEIKKAVEVDYENHHRLAQKAAESAIVLLKNEEVLPLKKDSKVAIIGDFAKKPRYQGAGSSLVNPYKIESSLDVVDNFDFQMMGYAKGFDRNGEENNTYIKEAVNLVKSAEVALVYIGLNEVDEVEGHDRDHMQLAKNQSDLLQALSKTGKKIIAIVSCGSVIEMPWGKYCDGIVHGYLAGQAGASAILKVITGEINPSGKLNETYPMVYEDCPSVNYYPGKERTSEYREGLYVGYRYYDKVGATVKYPFGFGLSYTTFKMSDLVINKDNIECTITNTGDMAGSEVVQLYIGKKDSKIYRPEKELKGFKKVYLEANESKVVMIPFDEYSFRCYDVSLEKFVVEKGEYSIFIGSSSRDIHLFGKISREGVELNLENEEQLEEYYTGNITDVNKETFEVLYGQKVPESEWSKNKALTINDSLTQMTYAKSFLARLTIKILIGLRNRSYKKGKPDLNLFFLSNMPFRAIAKMSEGNVSLKMTEDIVKIVNGHFFKGISALIKSFNHYKKKNKENKHLNG